MDWNYKHPKKPRVLPIIQIASMLLGCLSIGVGRADSWNGSIRTKFQADNRYHLNGDYMGEVWGQFAYDNPEYQTNARFSTLNRFSTDIYNNRQYIYQAFLEKTMNFAPVTLRGGRFERSDSLGLYLLDGGAANYQSDQLPLSFEVYGGRPVRVDHVRSVNGKLVLGTESLLKLTPNWSIAEGATQLENVDLRLGLQMLQRRVDTQVATIAPVDQEIVGNQFDAIELGPEESVITQKQTKTTYRLNGTARFAGHLLAEDKPMEVFLQGSYAPDKSRLENVFVDGWWDPLKGLRLRNYYESYRPKQPYVTFRDRFYSAYALGEQQVWRGSAQYKQNDKLTYSLGGQFANRDQGYRGKGFNAGLSYQFLPSLNFSGEFDYLELDSGEYANSAYVSVRHALNAKTRYGLNLAWRKEDKSLYGENQARGIENEWQYMINNGLILGFKGSYIFNTALVNEYLGAMQLTYYFDRFQASKP